MPDPELLRGPVLPDIQKAAAAGVTLGGLAGFAVASFWFSYDAITEVLKWASYSGFLAAVFGVALVLWGRVV